MGITSPVPPTRGRGRSSVDRPRPSPPARIAVGVDGGPSGQDAVVLASLLAQASGELLLIGVYEEPPPIVPVERGWASVQRQTRASLAETRDALAPDARIVVQPDVIVSRRLRQVVRREHRDLLVVGSGGQAADGQVRIGRNTRDLLCHLECPLAISPHGMRSVDRPGLERIGVGFDGWPAAQAALELGGSIATAAGAKLEVCAVVDDRVPGALTVEEIVLEGNAIVDEQARSLFNRTLSAARATGARSRVEVSRGSPADALRALATHVDLLVLGSNRSGPAGRVSLGSTGGALADGAPSPIMIAPLPDDAATG